jgi:hypothetical protein
MKRIAAVVCAGITLIGMSVAMEVAAWGVSGSPTSAVITFDDAARQVTLTIPTPPCPALQPDCQWKFFLNEPKLHVDVGILYGKSGTLTIPYPPNFCGVIQADAYIGGPPWVPKRGWQHTIEDCTPPEPPVTPVTPVTPATPTTAPTTTTISSAIEPPVNSPVDTLPPTTTTVSVPGAVAAASGGPQVGSSSGAPASTPAVASSQLPFTGVDVKPLFFMGMTLVGLGMCLMVRLRKGAHSRR